MSDSVRCRIARELFACQTRGQEYLLSLQNLSDPTHTEASLVRKNKKVIFPFLNLGTRSRFMTPDFVSRLAAVIRVFDVFSGIENIVSQDGGCNR